MAGFTIRASERAEILEAVEAVSTELSMTSGKVLVERVDENLGGEE